MLLLVDNYDSFVHNLARYFERLGRRTVVVRNTEIDAAGAEAMRPEAVVLSPGPGTPGQAGASLEIVRRLHDRVPMLGVCLGHQVIGEALGGRIVRAREPMHGAASHIRHHGDGLFAGLPNPLDAGRYHSLVVDEASLPECLVPTAWTDDGTLMAMRHRELPLWGLQFHPESILTPDGYRLLAAFLRTAGLPTAEPPPSMGSELRGSKNGAGDVE